MLSFNVTNERCNKTEGKALGHKDGRWETEVYVTINKSGLEVKECTVCGDEVNSRNTTLKPRRNGNAFNFSEDEFATYMEEHFSSNVTVVEGEETEGMPSYYIRSDDGIAIVSMKINASGKVKNILLISGDDTYGVAMKYKGSYLASIRPKE